MRIAHVTATFPPIYTGTGIVCYHNALELSQRGHEVTVYTAALPHHNRDNPEKLNIRRLPTLLRFGNAPVLPGLLNIRDVDLIHLHFPFYFGAELVALAAYRNRIPLVVTYHQDVLLKGFPGLVAAVHDQTLGAAALRSAACVLFTTLDYGRASKASSLLKNQHQIVSELPNGVDTQRFHPSLSGDKIRHLHHIYPDEIMLLMVAGLDRAHFFKGVLPLLEAINVLHDLPIRLIIVGDGDLRTSYEARAAELGLTHCVTFTGRVTAEQLPNYYAAADVGILPSTTMGEAFGMVLLEAMACGKPVIASDLPGVRVVVSDSQDGLLVQPGNVIDLSEKIIQLVCDKARRTKMGQAARSKVEEQYALPQIAARLESFYAAALSQHSSQHAVLASELLPEVRDL